MKYSFFLIFSFFSVSLIGQIKPEFFPEEVLTSENQIKCYCKPGVRNKSRSKGLLVSYRWLGASTFDPEDNSFTEPLSKYTRLQNITVDFKAPILNMDNLKLLAGYKYNAEYFDFKRFGEDFNKVFQELDNEQFKSNSLSMILSKPLDETRYLAFRFRYSTNGDYDNFISFKSKYSIYKLLGIYAMKPNEDFEWGIGLNISKSFRRTNILPFVVINKNFNEKWGIESALPGFIFIRHNLDINNILLGGVEYGSQSYRFDFRSSIDETISYDYNHSEIITSIQLEHQLAPWFWANLKTGYQLNFSSDFEGKSDFSPTFNAEPSNAFYFKIGIFLSPPDHF